ncbi:MAG TPA: helix-turn-helix transcriptional regulator [Chloroflexia bacterium]|nr:helix-turn-helix transcriptional regulator [Chloroflexia bacterium]
MDTRVNTLEALGPRIRQARRELGLSQEKLAQPEFTKSYVSAVERGKARPSLKALAIMSRRLNIPMNELLESAPATPDAASLAGELEAGLDAARLLIAQGQATAALARIEAATGEYGPLLETFDARLRYGIHYWRAEAYLRGGDPGSARQELTEAAALAVQLPDAAQEAERLRNLVGAAYARQGVPRLALEHHEAGRHAIDAGVIRDPHLQISVLRNLAADYQAVGDENRALEVYQEAAKLLDRTRTLAQQARVYADLSATYTAEGDLSSAQRYTAHALSLQQAAQDLADGARMSLDLAATLARRGDHAGAATRLAAARAHVDALGNDVLSSLAAEHQATLVLEQGHLDEAAVAAREAVTLSEGAYSQLSKDADSEAQHTVLHAYAQALRTAALVAERQARPGEADTLFKRALKVTADASDIAGDLEHSYAELLAARGAHEQASTHYRAALKHQQRPASR